MADSNRTHATRLPDGLEERYSSYRDERDMTDSEALRSLIRSGLDDLEAADEPSWPERYAHRARQAMYITAGAVVALLLGGVGVAALGGGVELALLYLTTGALLVTLANVVALLHSLQQHYTPPPSGEEVSSRGD